MIVSFPTFFLRVAYHPVAHFRRRDIARFEQCELLQAILGRLPSLHAGDGDGVPDALGSGFSVQVGGIHG
jgi:hypothetical protein